MPHRVDVVRWFLVLIVIATTAVRAAEPPSAKPPLLPEAVVAALANELSGTEARRTVQELTLHHRQRGSRGFEAASRAIETRLERYRLSEIDIIDLPADGMTYYGTQRSRPAWDVERAELWELAPEGEGWARHHLVDSWDHRAVALAQDSASGTASGRLVDVGAGTSEADYDGKSIAGSLVLTSSQPGAIRTLAVDRFGAGGIVSYAQNQRSAWWREDETLVRWGHVGTFPTPNTFSFMISLQRARRWQERLATGEEIRLEAVVEAEQHPGSYRIVTAAILGRDPNAGEIALSCHLDHQRPGANDNASGCATILEVARTLHRVIDAGLVPAPRRTIRWYWPPEIEGSIALLNARPEIPARTLAVIHMDMVGGNAAVTKAIFHVSRGPASLPSFVNDVAEAFGRFVNTQSDAFASAEGATYPLVDPEGGKEPLLADMADFSLGSDHQVWAEGSWRVPAIYLNDWPDRYIHTHKDSVANIDATKLLRAAFIGAASAYYLADLDDDNLPNLWDVLRRHALERAGATVARAIQAAEVEHRDGAVVLVRRSDRERAIVRSLEPFIDVPPAFLGEANRFFTSLDRTVDVPAAVPPLTGDGAATIYHRAPQPKGGMFAFGYSYLEDRLSREGLESPGLLSYSGLWGGGSEYAYEGLNLVDGRRTVGQIRDELTATYGPVPLGLVVDYLATLEQIGVLLDE